MEPIAVSAPLKITLGDTGSFNKINAKMIVMTTLNLSIGDTLDTSHLLTKLHNSF